MLEWDSTGIGSSSSLRNISRPFEKTGCVGETSRNSGLLITVPELVRKLAPMRYGLLAEKFYSGDNDSGTSQNVGNEQIVPSSPLAKLFVDNGDSQCESFYMRDKSLLSRNSVKSSGDESSFMSPLKLFIKEGVSECQSKINEIPTWKSSSSLFHGTERAYAGNYSVCCGRKVKQTIFAPAVKRNPLFRGKNHISTAFMSSYSHMSRTSFFDRFRYEKIPRASACKFLTDRDPKYKAKYV